MLTSLVRVKPRPTTELDSVGFVFVPLVIAAVKFATSPKGKAFIANLRAQAQAKKAAAVKAAVVARTSTDPRVVAAAQAAASQA